MSAFALNTPTLTPSTLAPMRINARLDTSASQQLQYLMVKTGLAMSDVLRAGLELLYKDLRKSEPQKKSALGSMVGKYGSKDTANNKKDDWADDIAKKYGLYEYAPKAASVKTANTKAKQ